MKDTFKYDVFISHASEDKENIAKPLAISLAKRGLKVWYDEFTLNVGDSLITEINNGLKDSLFGIIILSEAFFSKGWTEYEFKALLTRQINDRSKVLIPIWHGVSRQIVNDHYPMLTDIFALNSNIGIQKLTERILRECYKHPEVVKAESKSLTGIPFLDYITSGGLKKASSILIAGGKSIGKTTLALQIQKASLERNESCLFISYKELPSDIIKLYDRLDIDIEKYIESGRLTILDNYTCTLDISREDVLSNIPKKLHSGIVTVKDPSNIKEYYELQTRIMHNMGFGGVNIIDSINQRKKMIEKAIHIYGQEEFDKYFERFRANLSRIRGQIGLHIIDTEDETLFQSQRKFQDGIILMEKDIDTYLQLIDFKDIVTKDGKHLFAINSSGILFYDS